MIFQLAQRLPEEEFALSMWKKWQINFFTKKLAFSSKKRGSLDFLGCKEMIL